MQRVNTSPPPSLAQHWQHTAWAGQLPGFAPPLGIDEIAGLALLADVESLLVETRRSDVEVRYQCRQGPFTEEELTGLGDRDWTLLVRDIDRHLPELAGLWTHFDWLADWRRADIMVSIAAPGGSVGPHLDSYDVFLVQGDGEREWQLAPGESGKPVPGSELRLVECDEFSEVYRAGNGDVLYVPPGHIHHGVATSLCSTWSFGLQAPLLGDIAAMLDVEDPSDAATIRLRDAALPFRVRAGEIPESAGKCLFLPGVSEAELIDAIGRLTSLFKPGFDTRASRVDKLPFRLHPWTRIFWSLQTDALHIYCNGQQATFDPQLLDPVAQLCKTRMLTTDEARELVPWLASVGAFAEADP
ncbi:MAG: cupin domain-containing protein [Pseudomonadota bacterium]